MRTPDYDKRARDAVERMDVLEDELPSGACSSRGCGREPRYEWAGAFGTRWLCSRHREVYWVHERIVRRIRSL